MTNIVLMITLMLFASAAPQSVEQLPEPATRVEVRLLTRTGYRLTGDQVTGMEAMLERCFFREVLLSSDDIPRWPVIGSRSKQTKGIPHDL